MKIGLEVKNPGNALRPSRNNIILYNGKEWYVTTKEALFQDLVNKINEKEKELDSKIAECNSKIEEMNEVKRKNAEQILKIAAVVENFVKGGN